MDRFEEVLHRKGYKCVNLLGRGAVAQVYCVREPGTGERFACKISDRAELLRREFDYLQQISHPLFPAAHQFRQEDGVGFLIMEYVPGSNLAEVLSRRGHFSVRQTINIGMELAEGLLHLQESGKTRIFRDVKPENIVVRQDGRVKLLDLGCVCEMGENTDFRAGSPGFAAPEQFVEGAKLGLSCDVYGLGRTMEAMLGRTGSTKIKSPRSDTLQRRKRTGLLRRREGERQRKQLNKLIEACVCEEPSKRPPDMRAVLAALASLCEPQCKMTRRKKRFQPTFGIECIKNIWESEYKTLDV